ncbi:hypothetical protein [Aureitalea marina]|uniref:Uncharacterized protein n=1 Tax=Aureitalea marina TaxID=930804 RepID=A0A2S7KR11_9FLAO|nr:hypothetical protein [Aureitalea marina]PQB05003.1 hypothetical protein BST85_08945 [Aureitalea marina]
MRLTWTRLLLGIGLVTLMACNNRADQNRDLFTYVPANADYVWRFDNLDELLADLTNNDLIEAADQGSIYNSLLDSRELLQLLKVDSRSYLAMTRLNDSLSPMLIITDLRENPELLNSVEGLQEKGIPAEQYISQLVLGQNTYYKSLQDSILILSDSQLWLKEGLNRSIAQDSLLERILQIDAGGEVGMARRADGLFNRDSTQMDFASWVAMETRYLPEGIEAHGVVLARDSTDQFVRLFDGLNPQPINSLYRIPRDVESVTGFTYSDDERLFENLANYRSERFIADSIQAVFESINEITVIDRGDHQAVIMHSLDIDQSWLEIASFMTQNETYREIELYDFSQANWLSDLLQPLVSARSLKLAFQLNEHLIICSNRGLAESIISCSQQNNCLDSSSDFQIAADRISSSASYYLVQTDDPGKAPFANWFGLAPTNLKTYPLNIIQMSYDRDFAHVNLIGQQRQAETVSTSGSVSEITHINLDQDILGDPVFFSNHRTGGKDIVVQDVTNTLHLISSGGKILWSKALSEPILGRVKEVDILRNGKKQLAFTTTRGLHVLDRNGNAVAPFPKQFRDEITQPLALFDYDRNRNYRFVIVQGEEVHMYDRQGKTVKGFGFDRASSPIALPPVHIRMDQRDYLLFAEDSGKLNILSRRGKERIKVEQNFEFGENPLEQEGSTFVVITKDKVKHSITQSGTVRSQPLNVSNSYWFNMEAKVKATMDDNLLRINGRLVELPYGIYTSPGIFSRNRNYFVTVTETQDNKAYLIDQQGSVINGFPVFGQGAIDLGDANRNGKLNALVKGGDREIILYQID